ncbi:hypothetical protein G7077_01225 [Sphingomonas piscis]|uniref:DUF3617 family protein n=1 Tax=Sphingomonas piscis TaxID=2714943 RepID=A0A6G7YLY0_9SPHN|nr:DUF3617 family protein [Sphingomonas piscis]QIK77737.1 hypothetical protein G7077_01225 [Sphingomonas piscis]
MCVGATLVVAATPLPRLAQIPGGLWEVSGIPGQAPVRQCFSTRTITQFEHRGEACPRTVVSQSGDTTVLQYNCPSGGFGRSEVTVITPRSLRIDTQGISRGLPFHFVMQARRIGGCPGY